MSVSALVIGMAGLVLGLATVLLGRNLTRSVLAGYASVALLGLTMTLSGLGFAALAICLMATIGLATIQVFGWMLVDLDQDHLTPTDGPTWLARGLAFLLLGGGLWILVAALLPSLGEAVWVGSPSVASIGLLLFSELRGLAVLLGVALGAALLAALLLLRGQGEGS